MPDTLRSFATLCEEVAATPSKTAKVSLVASHLRSLEPQEASWAALFLAGEPLPRSAHRSLGVGFSLLAEALGRIVGTSEIMPALRRHGDLGEMTEELLSGREGRPTSLADVARAFDETSRERTVAGKVSRLGRLLETLRAVEAKYVVKVLFGDLRIGLQASLVEEAIAEAFSCEFAAVQRAQMLLSDISETLSLARVGRLAEARLVMFRPVGFMLASAAETAEEALEAVGSEALVEDKYDGIRAQAHVGGGKVMLFSRNLEEIPEFPELLPPLRDLPGELVLDGEILGYEGDRPIPFTRFQRRLGRKQRELFIADEVPVKYLVFDLLQQDGVPQIDSPLRERRSRLEALFEGRSGLLALAKAGPANEPGEVQSAFERALLDGNEGVMVKDPASLYRPGRRGRSWMKLKRPLATLDCVVTGVEYGHGKRKGVLSDYTFSVRDGEELKTLGKAFTGLTDVEIERLTPVFLSSTLEERGGLRRVRPEIVLEVAFSNIQPSSRHESGFALRFPRIVRLRPDKSPREVDTLDRVRELYQKSAR